MDRINELSDILNRLSAMKEQIRNEISRMNQMYETIMNDIHEINEIIDRTFTDAVEEPEQIQQDTLEEPDQTAYLQSPDPIVPSSDETEDEVEFLRTPFSLRLMEYLRDGTFTEGTGNNSWESIVDSIIDTTTNRLLNGDDNNEEGDILDIFARELDGLLDYSSLEDVKVILTDSQFEKYVHTNPVGTLSDNCVICMGSENGFLGVSQLPCGHQFHSNCIEKWLKQYSVSCPSCRKDVRDSELTEQN